MPAGPPHTETSCCSHDFILTGLQRVRIVGRRTSLGQRSEQDEAGDAIWMIRRELDAGRPALGRAEQDDPAAARRIKHGARCPGGCLDAGIGPDPVGKADAATIEQDETAHPGERGQECPAPGLLPDPFDVGHEAGQQQNIMRPAP